MNTKSKNVMRIQPLHFQADSGFLKYKLYRRLSSPHDSKKNHQMGSFMANTKPVDQITWTLDE